MEYHGDEHRIMLSIAPGIPREFEGEQAKRVSRWVNALAMDDPDEMAATAESTGPTRGIRRVGDPEPAEGGSATASGGAAPPAPILATGRVHPGQTGPGEGTAKIAELPPPV